MKQETLENILAIAITVPLYLTIITKAFFLL